MMPDSHTVMECSKLPPNRPTVQHGIAGYKYCFFFSIEDNLNLPIVIS